MERFKFKKINEVESKEEYRVEVSIGLQLWKIWTLRWIFRVLGKQLGRI
jgi:hypothetical protein